MAARNEIAKATIYLDGKQAEAALAKLKHQVEELRKETYDYQEFLFLTVVIFLC